jgi:hypothetical protein
MRSFICSSQDRFGVLLSAGPAFETLTAHHPTSSQFRSDQTLMVKHADAMGYDMVSVPEHLVIPKDQVEWSGAYFFSSTTAHEAVVTADRVGVGRGRSSISWGRLRELGVTARAVPIPAG